MKVEHKEFTLLAPFSVQKDATVIDNSDDSIIKIAGLASYSGMNADGSTYSDLTNDIVNIFGMDLSVYAENPLVLLNHDREKVIGKATLVEKRVDSLYIECEIHKGAMDPEDFYRIKSGILSYFSIGFRSITGSWVPNGAGESWSIDKSLLLEISACALPCNSKAKFNVVKSLPDGNFTSEKHTEEYVKTTEEIKEETSMTNIKLKRSDLLSGADLEQFKNLGGDIEAEVEVSLASFIKGLVAQEVQAVLEAKQKEAADIAAAEAEALAVKEAELAAQVEAEAAEAAALAEAAAVEEEKELAEELGEMKSLIETLKAALAVEEK